MTRSGDILPGPAKPVLMKLASVKAWQSFRLLGVCPAPVLQSLVVQGLIEVSVPGQELDTTDKTQWVRITEEGRQRLRSILGK